MLNRITIIGRLCKTPELLITKDGKPVANFVVAVNREHCPQKVDFIDCVAWHRVAENFAAGAKTGQVIAVSGAMQNQQRKTEGGEEYFGYVLNANRIIYMEPRDSVQEQEGFETDILPESVNIASW